MRWLLFNRKTSKNNCSNKLYKSKQQRGKKKHQNGWLYSAIVSKNLRRSLTGTNTDLRIASDKDSDTGITGLLWKRVSKIEIYSRNIL